MNRYSSQSEYQLQTCDPRLQRVFREVLVHVDHTVVEGHRRKEDQDRAFNAGLSKLKWPNGKHNGQPSLAVDVAPYPVDFSNRFKAMARFYHLAGWVLCVANFFGVDLRWGGDWDGDRDFDDQTFDDLGHFEIKT